MLQRHLQGKTTQSKKARTSDLASSVYLKDWFQHGKRHTLRVVFPAEIDPYDTDEGTKLKTMNKIRIKKEEGFESWSIDRKFCVIHNGIYTDIQNMSITEL